MRRKFLFAFLVLSLGISAAAVKLSASNTNQMPQISAVAAADVDLNGKWTLSVSLPDQSLPVSLELTQTDQTFTGTMSSAMGNGNVTNGKITDSDFTAVIQANIQGQTMDIQMSGKYEADKITGSLSIPNADPFAFEGTKVKE